ncbi:MAG TPA: AMP-binding protein, partial [Afifellaceae bacterium]|nr:AMP-binding protein [Afifellaceae bacterium]
MGLFDRISSEVAYLKGALRTLSKVTPVAKNPDRTFPDVADELAAEHGDAVALISERERMTFRQYNERANQYARWAMSNSVKKGDCVALMMPNRPEFMALWLGIARAGGVTAFLNTNLRGPVLAHCVNIVKPVHVVVDADLIDAFKTADQHLDSGPSLACLGAAPEGWTHLDPVLAALETTNIAATDRPKLTTMDKCLYIYTSGTTGLPK